MNTRDPRLDEHHALVDALQRSLGEGTERIETHISTLLLSGGFAYKLRKPLALGFLDFSTAGRRRADCEEELRLNRRTAPQLYLDVLPVFGPAAQARFGRADEAGEPIDWLLRMRRFDNDGLLDRLAARGELTDTLIDALATRVASFHDALPASPAAYGDPQAVLSWARANFEALGGEAPAALREWTEREFARIAPLLALRRAQGFVREGHGDLHLGNIVRIDGEPLPFDGIEFNAALRHTDTMADLAFTFMDLWRHGLPRQAWRFASGYAEHTGDYGGLALLPFFAVYRALVRAQVASLRLGQAGNENASAAARAALARDLRVACELSHLPQAQPKLVLSCGLSGSGKSTVALALLQPLGAVRIRSDVERKRLAGVAITARPTDEQARQLYSRAMNTRTYARLQSLAQAAVARRPERDRRRRRAASLRARRPAGAGRGRRRTLRAGRVHGAGGRAARAHRAAHGGGPRRLRRHARGARLPARHPRAGRDRRSRPEHAHRLRRGHAGRALRGARRNAASVILDARAVLFGEFAGVGVHPVGQAQLLLGLLQRLAGLDALFAGRIHVVQRLLHGGEGAELLVAVGREPVVAVGVAHHGAAVGQRCVGQRCFVEAGLRRGVQRGFQRLHGTASFGGRVHPSPARAGRVALNQAVTRRHCRAAYCVCTTRKETDP